MLTLDWLVEQGACADGREWFVAYYPDGVTPASAEGFVTALLAQSQDWARWLVGHSPLWAECERQVAPLRAEYGRQVDALWAEYGRQVDALWAEYRRQDADLLRHLLCQWLATPTEEGR